MTRVYRILRQPFARTPLDGEGAYLFGGRWSSPGTRLAYTSEHLSLAMLEYFVHIDADNPPKDLVVVAADIPAKVSRTAVSVKQLSSNWRAYPAPSALARWGDQFVDEGRAAVLVVPSALAPSESNWLINPLHRDFAKIRIHRPEPLQYDRRFFA